MNPRSTQIAPRRIVEPRLLTLVDAARAWAVSERHVRGLVASGAVRVVRIGHCVRISRDEIERVAAEGCGWPVDGAASAA